MSLNDGQSNFTIKVSTTAPAGAATTTLFDSTTAFGVGSMRHLPIERLSLSVYHDQTFTLLADRSSDGGTNWDTYFSQAYTAPAANAITGPVDFLLDTEHEFRLRVTNGGVTQTTWRPAMKGFEVRVPGI